MLRVSVLAFAFAVQAIAGDNWLIGTWSSAAGLTYAFTADDITMTGPNGKLGPFKVTSYDVVGDTVTVTAEGLPGKAIAKKTDDTHATLDTGDGAPVALTKQ
jgi:hypothetical protein